jgi:gamma-glutamylcyclotransferase (GGCT)/AIG2-like uncharacterized protein YtfP
MRLFIYGTLLDPACLSRFAGRAVPMRPAHLPGWRRVRLRGTPYPTLIRARAGTEGAVITVGATALRRLRAYEGPRYRECRVVARVAGRPVAATAWLGDAGLPRGWP